MTMADLPVWLYLVLVRAAPPSLVCWSALLLKKAAMTAPHAGVTDEPVPIGPDIERGGPAIVCPAASFRLTLGEHGSDAAGVLGQGRRAGPCHPGQRDLHVFHCRACPV